MIFKKTIAKCIESILLARDIPNTEKTIVVVMGVQRSGTSLVTSLVHAAGTALGDASDVRGSDVGNPAGYFENKRLNRLTKRYFKEAGLIKENLPLYNTNTFRAKGVYGKFRRLFTKSKLMKFAYHLYKENGLSGFKTFPYPFYVLRQFFPKYKIIAVFRNPYAVAHSYQTKWQNGHTFEQVLKIWTESNKSLLYHLSQADHLLVQYEDLHDMNTRSVLIDKIISFLDSDVSRDEVESHIKSTLNRSGETSKWLTEHYPLPPETKEVYEKLKLLKV
ncbi:sulfotransferase domain-containing protein [Candidatus Pacebacteria bacterium]|nr:sulfotransferase domain-containing protein [Candidatus Paceibacterota bacterium]